MSKENLYRALCHILKDNEYYIKCQLDEFFESNVVTPKGTNHHPNADVLHQIAEDTTINYQVSSQGIEWNKGSTIYTTQYRIKPTDPIYEWQWLVLHNKQAFLVSNGRFHTEEELTMFTEYIKIEETKRIKQ